MAAARLAGAVMVLGLSISAMTTADAAAVRRGVDASSSSLAGRLTSAPTATEGTAIRVDLRRTRRWSVQLQPTRSLRIRVSGCRGLVQFGTSRSRLRTAALRGGWQTIRVASGTTGRIRRIFIGRPASSSGHGRRCSSLLIDRVDVEAAPVPLGVAARADFLSSVPSYRDALQARFDALTPENELKMEFTQPARGVFSFGAADQLVDEARRNGFPVRGHTLVYDRQLPAWLTAPATPWTRATLLEVLRQHITTVMAHYRGAIDRWDVVNEAVAGDGTLKPSIWQRVIGDDYIDWAFRFARAADPAALLIYNDHTLERPAAHQDGVVRLLAGLRARNVPVDGVGLEAHIEPDNVPTAGELDTTFDRFGALGLRVEITEADNPLPGPATPARIASQSLVFARLANACWEHTACDRMTVWGVDDGHSWRGPAPSATLLDASYAPKPAYRALQAALRGDH